MTDLTGVDPPKRLTTTIPQSKYLARCTLDTLFVQFTWAEAELRALSRYRPLHLRCFPPAALQQEQAGGHLLSWGQKSAVNCAQSSFSGWVTTWSRQRAGIGDLLSSLGITCKRYTDWGHNKLTPTTYTHSHTCTLRTHSHRRPQIPLYERAVWAARKGSLLLLGLFSSVNCVITHGSGRRRCAARFTERFYSFLKK